MVHPIGGRGLQGVGYYKGGGGVPGVQFEQHVEFENRVTVFTNIQRGGGGFGPPKTWNGKIRRGQNLAGIRTNSLIVA